ncbi:MAG: glycine cleavage system protein GcvH [Rhodospirillales bacterium]|jgi:glycine cleavage system H protein|nr:glycine cleavage system protein GcvH [Rhodospirillales bacterium]HIJ43897.1 glycine cleavage system protein GcvH [Rhodospirillaceae bacterium]MDP7097332.1 glycine cleavage system protein GcvH [Rhodospirillales bacterium]MDP7215757.1 glycine cleavage system protein GcvH [Rhodospirillales bacterium]HIJ46330.1 glycine cleavage system protein GcvH [Rhodospirillaceae bacterium]
MPKVKYSQKHEWISVEDGVGTIGITDYAQGQLGDVVFVELPEVGQRLDKGAEAAVIESVKAASEVYAPASGQVTEVNESLADDPAQVNADALGEGWFFKIALADPADLDDLMDAHAYAEYVKGL